MQEATDAPFLIFPSYHFVSALNPISKLFEPIKIDLNVRVSGFDDATVRQSNNVQNYK